MHQPTGETAIAIDLGRHRTFCALGDADGQRLVPLSDKHDGLVLRWLTDRGSERVTERLLRLAGVDDDAAIDTALAVADAVFPELADGETLATSPWVAIPPSFGPACRQALLRGLAGGGVPIRGKHLIDRPIASLAGWLVSAEANDHMPSGMVLVIDNDGGQLSAAAADLDSKRLLFSVPLSIGPDDDIEEVGARLRVLVEEAHRLEASDEVVRLGDWRQIAASIEHVVLTGSASQHPRFVELVEEVLPDAALVGVRSVNDQAHTVVFGLLNLGVLAGYTACWPTGKILLDGVIIRSSGPVRGNDIDLDARVGSTISFTGPDGDPLPVEIGCVQSSGLEVPSELCDDTRLRLLSDGRILVLGPAGVRPLSFRVRWPVSATDAVTLPVDVIGRRAVQLTDPKVALRRRATVGS
ncbi:MAG: hypothetical protein ACI8TP_002879 [Acidimicrobiales bacterium]|jgi:hypothetical protein